LLSCHLRLPAEEDADRKLQQGIAALEAGNPDEAIKQWEEVAARYPYTRAWGPQGERVTAPPVYRLR
jgi:outer membrane protein assembly factor BamD (BamD/ComL family)